MLQVLYIYNWLISFSLNSKISVALPLISVTCPGKSSKVDKEQVVVHGSKGSTWQEWMDEGADRSEFYTMDYSQVRRRRPVHNKSMPVGP